MSTRGVAKIPAGANRVLMPGQLHLNPAIAPSSATDARPFAPGEYIRNPSGSWSSEVTAGVNDPRLNGGAPTVVPTLWLIRGKPYRVTPQEAVKLALASKIRFPAFPNWKTANAFTNNRESQWDSVGLQGAANVPALWHIPPTTMAPSAQAAPAPAKSTMEAIELGLRGGPKD